MVPPQLNSRLGVINPGFILKLIMLPMKLTMTIWGFPEMGVPRFFMENPEMDDDWGYPYFRKPPYLAIAIQRTGHPTQNIEQLGSFSWRKHANHQSKKVAS